VRFDHQAQFHPLKFMKAIASDLTIYENTRVIDVEQSGNTTVPDSKEKSIVITDKGKVAASYVVFACHYPFINIPGYYFARMHQERSYIIALSGADNVKGMYLGVDMQGYSFRNYGELLLLSGSGHRTGENQDGGCYEALRKVARKWYPQSKEEYAWSAQDCISLDAVPYIGQYAESRKNWYVATGFRKWGMTHSMVAAGIISSMIAKKVGKAVTTIGDLYIPEGKENIYSPHRFSIPVSAENLWKDVKTISKALLKEAFDMPKEELDQVQKGHGGIIEYRGEKIGVYRDMEGQVYMVDTRCRHMSCQLAWNPEELTWDCPCHGSRFDYQGNLVTGPATTDLQTPGGLLK
jgi:Rieske Fe-S protein